MALFGEIPPFGVFFVIFTKMGVFHQKGHFWAKMPPRGDFGLEKVWGSLGFSMVGGGCPRNAPRRKNQVFAEKLHFSDFSGNMWNLMKSVLFGAKAEF